MFYQIAIANHLGNRNSNQDRFDVIETAEGVLLVLADGMGGLPSGELAAQMLVNTVRRQYLGSERPIEQVENFFTTIIQTTHHALVQWADKQGSDVIPGTTAVLCLIQNGRIDWAHVGDSRLYIFRGGLPIFRTNDHSYVEQLYRQGVICHAERDTHPCRSSITQCVGGQSQMPEVELGAGKNLQVGDRVLLCSDGLWGALDDAQLGLLLGAEGALDDILEAMAMRAEQNTYPHSDNISAIALHLISLAASPSAAKSVNKSTSLPVTQEKNADELRLKNAIEQIEEAWRIYKDELGS